MEASSIQRVDHSKSTVLIGGGTGERETGCTRVPHSGGSRVEVIPVLGFVLRGDLSVSQHLTETLGSCTRVSVRSPYT